MAGSERAIRAGVAAEEDALRIAGTIERGVLEKDYGFLCGQNAYLSMLLTETWGTPHRDAGDALRCLGRIPLDELDAAERGPSRVQFLQLVDAHGGQMLLALHLLRKIAVNLAKAAAEAGGSA